MIIQFKLQISQQISQQFSLGTETLEWNRKFWKSNFRLQTMLLLQYSCMCNDMYFFALPYKIHAVACIISLPALPDSCAYVSASPGGPQWITWWISGQSIPIPNAVVAIMILSLQPTVVNDLSTSSRISMVDALVNISTKRNSWKSGEPIGKVKCWPRWCRKPWYNSVIWVYLRQNITVFEYSKPNLFSSAAVVIQKSLILGRGFTVYFIFGRCGGSQGYSLTNGLQQPTKCFQLLLLWVPLHLHVKVWHFLAHPNGQKLYETHHPYMKQK